MTTCYLKHHYRKEQIKTSPIKRVKRCTQAYSIIRRRMNVPMLALNNNNTFRFSLSCPCVSSYVL